MAALLVFSPKCTHSVDIINFINSHSSLKSVIQYHNVNTQGVPPQYKNKLTHVPTLLTKDGKMLVGQEIKQWLNSIIPTEITNWSPSKLSIASIDNESFDDSLFDINKYGQPLQPVMTRELEEKINRNVGEAFSKMDK
jgi:hypothetical protein